MSDKPRVPPQPGEVVKVMGRELSLIGNGPHILSKRKGREDVIHPNFTRAMDAINLACGVIW